MAVCVGVGVGVLVGIGVGVRVDVGVSVGVKVGVGVKTPQAPRIKAKRIRMMVSSGRFIAKSPRD